MKMKLAVCRVNDIRDIRENPEKWRQAMRDRGKDPAEIDRLLEADEDARLVKTIQQNLRSQANIRTDLFALNKNEKMPPEVKLAKVAALNKKLDMLREEEYVLAEKQIKFIDKALARRNKKIAECDRKLVEWATSNPYLAVLEEICDEIKENCKGEGI
jgi:seryl-tRNA synthetase